MIESGFFNGIAGDRKYTAEQLNRMVTGFLSENGVFKNAYSGFKVGSYLNMTISVTTGRARMQEHFVNNLTPEYLTLEASDVMLNRYDAIVLCLYHDERVVRLEVKQGAYAEAAIKPTPERTAEKYEMVLAYVYVAAGVTKITENDIIDTREDEALCGYVKLLADGVNASVTKLENEVYLEEDTTSINAGISQIDTETDCITVDVNGIMLKEDVDYNITGTGSETTINFPNKMDVGNNIGITVIKPVLEVVQ